jgi:hypothetical protein
MTSTVDPRPDLPGDRILRPGTPAFTASCAGFDLSAVPAPDLVVAARGEDDVRAAVRMAADRGLPIAVRATGHGPIDGGGGGLLIDTRALSAVTVDPGRRTATAGGGAIWSQVLAACAPHGLVPVCGSAPGVGVAAYTLGGGLSPIGRAHGWATDHVRRIRLVTADGAVHELTGGGPAEDGAPSGDLFWAVRGGGGNFGVATELEFDLFDGTALYGGGLFLPGAAAAELLDTFGRVTATAPDELSLSAAFLTFPNIEPIPAPVRGRFVAHLRVTYLGTPAAAERLIAPLRAVATPLLDTVRTLPIIEFGSIHGDPTRPQPVSCGGAVLPRRTDAAIEVLLGGIGADTPHMLEIRHLGGALARPPAVPDAVGHRDAALNIFTSAYPGRGFADGRAAQVELYRRLRPFTGGRSIYNFTAEPDGRPADACNAFGPDTFGRLQRVKAAVDPWNLFRFNVNVPPAAGATAGVSAVPD